MTPSNQPSPSFTNTPHWTDDWSIIRTGGDIWRRNPSRISMWESIAAVSYLDISYLVGQFQLRSLHRIPYFSLKGRASIFFWHLSGRALTVYMHAPGRGIRSYHNTLHKRSRSLFVPLFQFRGSGLHNADSSTRHL